MIVANVLSLALKINADASGFRLDPVTRALQGLGTAATQVTSQFDKFAAGSETASRVQAQFAEQLQSLQAALQNRSITAKEFAEQFGQLSVAARQAATTFEEGARVTEANRTAEERRARELERLDRLLAQGAIEQETYNRAAAQSSGANEAAAAAERERADALSAADRIIRANLTPQQRYDQQVQELTAHLQAGRIQQETFDRAVASATASFVAAESAARGYDRAVEAAGDGGTLKFNELAGVLSALPGPFGAIAGRISGLASAGEGLGRVFSAGLSQGISGIAASLNNLITPTNAAFAGIAALGVGATAVARGLTQLEDRVENLGNIADKLGVSFGFIQTLEESARRSGTSVDAVSFAFARLQRSVLGVDEDSKSAQRALAQIGLTAEQIKGLAPEEQYRLIGSALAGIEDPAKRTAAAVALFGRSGADLLPFFRNLPGATEDMQNLGRALSALDRQRIDNFGAGLDQLAVATRSLGQTLLLPFAGFGEGLTRASAQFTALITAIADTLGRLLEPALRQVGGVLTLVGNGIGLLTPAFRALSQVLEPIGNFILPAVVAQLVAINRVAIAGTITALARSFAAAAAAAAGYAASARTAALSTVVLSTSIRGLLASTGVGALVVGLGVAAETLGVFGSSSNQAAAGVADIGTSADTAEQSFGKLAEAVKSGQNALDAAIAKAAEFGNAGFNAAFQFKQALDDLNEQRATEKLDADQYSRGIAIATKEFESQVGQLRRVQEETRKAASETKARVDADRQVVNSLLEQERITRQFGGDQSRAKAAAAVLTIEREIARLSQRVFENRNEGDTRAVERGQERIRQLSVILQQQQAIADGSAKAAADEAKRLEDQRQRVQALLTPDQTQIEKQLADVEEQLGNETLRLFLEGSNQAIADASRERIAQLQDLRESLQVEQQAIAQGFTEGFDNAFAETRKQLNDLINKAAEFGNEGAKAGQQLQEAVAVAEEQTRAARITNRPAYDAAIAAAKRIAEEQIARLEVLRQRQQQAQQEAFQRQVAANERINAFLAQGVNRIAELEKQRDLEALQRRQTAAENVREIDNQIKSRQDALLAAREAGDKKAENARRREIRALEQLQRQEQTIVDRKVDANRQVNSAVLASADAQAAQQQQFANAARQQVGQLQTAANNAVNLTNEAFAKAADRQRKLLEDLNTLGSRTVQTADVRTAEGAAIVLGLAANAQDPRLIEQRLGNKIMREIAEGLADNLNRIGIPATLL